MLLSGGCEDPALQQRPAPGPGQAALRKDRKGQLETLTAEKADLEEQLEELRQREKLLAAEVTRLQFENDQQKNLIEALAPALTERDEYKAKVEELTATVARLRQKITELQRGPAATTQPANR